MIKITVDRKIETYETEIEGLGYEILSELTIIVYMILSDMAKESDVNGSEVAETFVTHLLKLF